MGIVLLFLAGLLLISAATALSLIKANKKLRLKIDSEFGKKPTNQKYK